MTISYPRASASGPGTVNQMMGDEIMALFGAPLAHLDLGTLYRRSGKPEQAREHLTTATALYREMDMCFWLQQAEAAR